MIDDILSRHDYPAPVSALLAEAVALTALLGTALKFDGKFILQTKTDGPVRCWWRILYRPMACAAMPASTRCRRT